MVVSFVVMRSTKPSSLTTSIHITTHKLSFSPSRLVSSVWCRLSGVVFLCRLSGTACLCRPLALAMTLNQSIHVRLRIGTAEMSPNFHLSNAKRATPSRHVPWRQTVTSHPCSASIANPPTGSSSGPDSPQTVLLTFTTAALSAGSYTGRVSVSEQTNSANKVDFTVELDIHGQVDPIFVISNNTTIREGNVSYDFSYINQTYATTT